MFDTIDHEMLLNVIKDTFGIHGYGNAWKWFESYFSGRIHHVAIENVMSESAELLFGFPQGCVIRPFKLCIYTLTIGVNN